MTSRSWIFFGLLGCVVSGLAFFGPGDSTVSASPTKLDELYKPMDVNMHDYMEGVFESSYRRLKPLVSKQPGNNSTWKSIRAESLVLGEGCNSLLFRLPENDADAWKSLAVENREACAALLAAAKEKNYETARKAYEVTLEKCNACHNKFAEGKHQMNP